MNFFESIETLYENQTPASSDPTIWEKLDAVGGFKLRMSEMFPDILPDTVKFLQESLDDVNGEGNVIELLENMTLDSDQFFVIMKDDADNACMLESVENIHEARFVIKRMARLDEVVDVIHKGKSIDI